MNIYQVTPKAIVHYDTFNIANGHGVVISQPTSSSALLARISGADESVIDGILQANGHVYISNPNGIIFGHNATINVGALLATTLNIADPDFLNGVLRFQGDSQAAIENHTKNISGEQFVALLGQKIENVGNIQAGQVIAAAASEVVVDNAYGGSISVDINGLLGSVDNRGNLDASVQNGVNSGSIVIKGDHVAHSGKAKAKVNNNFDGGYINFYGEHEVITEKDSFIEAKGDEGIVGVSSGENGTTLLHGTIEASGNDLGQEGGEVHILGNRIGVLNEAKIDVSGHDGGGTVLIGGDYQGSNPDIRNASRTYISPETSIKADALKTGDGGDVIVWSEETTGFYGDISARGGAESGDGGFIEISGKKALDYNGFANVLSPAGKNGTVLFDPINGVISDADGAEGPGINPGEVLYSDIAADEPWNVTPDQLNTVAGNIVLQFNNDLIIEDDVVLTTPGATFTAEAGDDIIINAGISTNAGPIMLTANHPRGSEADTGTSGSITMASGTEISSGNQSVTLRAQGNISLAAVSTTGDVTITSTSGSVIDINGTDINLKANNVRLDSNGEINLDTTIASVDASTTGVGNIDLTETDAIILRDVDTTDGSITVVAGDTITAIDAESLTDADGNDINLEATSGGAMIGRIDAKNSGDVTLTVGNGSVLKENSNSIIKGADLSINVSEGAIGSSEDPIATEVTRYLDIHSDVGGIYLNETDSITIENVTSTSTVVINAETISGDDTTDDTDIVAPDVELQTNSNIGARDNPLNLGATSIVAETSDNEADINLSNQGNIPITLTNLTTQDGSIKFTANTMVVVERVWAQDDSGISGLIDDSQTITISTADDIQVRENGIQADFEVNLNAKGNISDGDNTNGVNITSGGNINLTIGGRTGSLNNPLDIKATNKVNLASSGSELQIPVWAMLSGTASGSSSGESVQFAGPDREPPGLIVWNGEAISGENEDIQGIDRAQSFYNETRFLIHEQPAFMSAFFRHVMVSMNELWTIPSIEYINLGGGFIFGLPKELKLPSSMNVHNTQDAPYRWYSLPLSLTDNASPYF